LTKIAAIAFAVAIAAAGAARAESWVVFLVAPQGVIYIDHDSISKRAGHVSARLESTFPKPQALKRDGRIILYIKTIDQVDVDCAARVYRNISRDLYTDTGLMQLSLNQQADPLQVTDNSPQDGLIKAYCR